MNEFGQGGDDEGVEEKTANKPLTAPPDADASVKEGEEIQIEAKTATTGSSASKGASAKKRK